MSVVLELEQLRGSIALVQRAFSASHRTRAEQARTILTNSSFLLVLEAALARECVAREARDFLLQCLVSRRISPHALISLSFKYFPERKESREAVWRRGGGLSQLLLALHEQSPQRDLLVEAAAADTRVLPHLLQCVAVRSENESFFAFLLGDPEASVGVLTRTDSAYLQARIALLSRLASELHTSGLAERLLVSFMVWNGPKPSLAEAYALWPLCRALACWPESRQAEAADTAVCLFEYICQVHYSTNGAESMLVECVKILSQLAQLPDLVVFQLAALLITRSVGPELFQHAVGLIQLKSTVLAQVLCAKNAIALGGCAQALCAIKASFELKPGCKLSADEDMPQTRPFTTIGHLALLFMKGQRSDLSHSASCNTDLSRLCFFLALAKHMEAGELLPASHFVSALSNRLSSFDEIFFILTSVGRRCSFQTGMVTGVLADLVTAEVANETEPEQRLRISWILDYFEECCEPEDLKGLLPRLAFDASSNLIFAYVQRKLPFLLGLNDGQFPYFAALCGMLRVSETRQSRLQFIATSALSWLASVSSGKILVVECRALSLAFQLLSRLARLAVLDPRSVWSKYSSSLLLRLDHAEPATCALAVFAGAFKAVSRSKDDQIDHVVSDVLGWLIGLLETTRSLDVFAAVCQGLASLDIGCLRDSEYSRLVKLLPAADEEGEPISYETDQVLTESPLFNAETLWSLCRRISASDRASFRLLWTALVDFEVASMSRSSFLGTESRQKSTSSHVRAAPDLSFMTSVSGHASFCAHIFKGPSPVSPIREPSVFIASELRVLILGLPLVSQMSWLVRPHLAVHIRTYISRLLEETDDVALLRRLSSYALLLEETGSWPATPQVSGGIVMAVSGMMRVLYDRGFISLKQLCEGWLSKLLGNWQDVTRFSCLSANDDFVAAVAVSSSLFIDVSDDVQRLLDAFLSHIVADSRWKDGSMAAFTAIENLSKDVLVDLLNQPKTTSKRKLCALQALLRSENESVLLARLDPGAIADPISSLALMAAGKPRSEHDSIADIAEPLEFKGIRSVAVGRAPCSEAAEKAKRNAFATGPIPAAFKLESIITYSVMAGFDALKWEIDAARSRQLLADLKQIASTTTDAKCCSLIHALATACAKAALAEPRLQSEVPSQTAVQSHLALLLQKIRAREEVQFCVAALAECKLLPRLDWGPFSLDPRLSSALVLKHVVSLTPLTNTHHISPSLKEIFVRLVAEKESLAVLGPEERQRLVELTVFILPSDEAWSLLSSLPLDRTLVDGLMHILSMQHAASELSAELCRKILSLVLAFSLKSEQLDEHLLRLVERPECPVSELEPEMAFAVKILRLDAKTRLLPVLRDIESFSLEARQQLFGLLKRKLLAQSAERVSILCELLDALLIRDDYESNGFLVDTFLSIGTCGSGELAVFALNLAATEFGQSERLRSGLLKADFLPEEFYGAALAAYEGRDFAGDSM